MATSAPEAPDKIATKDVRESSQQPSPPKERSLLSRVRLNWQLKVVIPVAAVLLNGILIFMVATLSLEGPQRHTVMIVASVGAVAVCAALLIVLAALLRGPVLELQNKIARVRDGDLNVTVNFAHRSDDIGDLGRNFNEMVKQLRESRAEIERLHRTQISRAEHLATLGELAAGLAHEIRNPLAGIAGVIEIIGRDLPDSSPARSVLKDVRQEVMHINRIVSQLLDCARPKPPEILPADLNATAEHAVMFAREQAMAKTIDFELIECKELPSIEHDTSQVHQVLLNLLLNSIQAIDGKGSIKVELGRQGKFATVTVKDSGRGIPPELLANIFRPFYTTKGYGTGLGLSLAKRIVEEHGGQIEVTSAPGEGATFTVMLPIGQAPLRCNRLASQF